ncbi:hypothetical protein ABPG77_006730 [Micractinium sp. CCAP 211/92]
MMAAQLVATRPGGAVCHRSKPWGHHPHLPAATNCSGLPALQVVPEGRGAPWVHTDEGDDDMPAHCKASMMGSSVTIPITNGRFNMGTWQGVWLCEHRDRGGRRRLVVTIQGE